MQASCIPTLEVNEGDQNIDDNEGPSTPNTSRAVNDDRPTAPLTMRQCGLLQTDILGDREPWLPVTHTHIIMQYIPAEIQEPLQVHVALHDLAML